MERLEAEVARAAARAAAAMAVPAAAAAAAKVATPATAAEAAATEATDKELGCSTVSGRRLFQTWSFSGRTSEVLLQVCTPLLAD